jgi:hypothetical protein
MKTKRAQAVLSARALFGQENETSQIFAQGQLLTLEERTLALPQSCLAREC